MIPTEAEVIARIENLNTLFKMFSIEAVASYHSDRKLPFYLTGQFGGCHQGISKESIVDLEDVAHSFMSNRPYQAILGEINK